MDAAEKELAATVKAGATLVAHGEAALSGGAANNRYGTADAVHVRQFRAFATHVRRPLSGRAPRLLPGRKMARILSHGLAEAGLLVTSGLARGIDTAAHEAATPARTAAAICRWR